MISDFILLCAHCSSEGVLFNSEKENLDKEFMIECSNCGIQTPWCDNFQIVIRIWNTRAPILCAYKYKKSPFENKLICVNCLDNVIEEK